MRKREKNIDFSRLARLLAAWENAALSQGRADGGNPAGEEDELDDMAFLIASEPEKRQAFASAYPESADTLDLYIELKEAMRAVAKAACDADPEYEFMERNADDYISLLAAREKRRKRGRWERITVGASVAACAAVVLTATWMNPFGSGETLPASDTRLAEAGKEKPAEKPDVKAVDARIPEMGHGVERNIPKTASTVTKAAVKREEQVLAEASKEAEIPVRNPEEMAWDKFMAMREEMSEVVNPGQYALAGSDFPDFMNLDISIDCEIILNDFSQGLEDTGRMFNSIIYEL